MHCGEPLAFLENGKLNDNENLVLLDAEVRVEGRVIGRFHVIV